MKLDDQVREVMKHMRDTDLEGNAGHDAWETRGIPAWQAAIIRLARPLLLWLLGGVVMGAGVVIVGVVEAFRPGVGLRMATAMAALLRAYPAELYLLVAAMFGGQAALSFIQKRRGS